MPLGRRLKDFFKRAPGFRALDRYLCYRYTGWYVPERFPRGHFYSPLPGYSDVARRRKELFDVSVMPREIPGLDPATQLRVADALSGFRSEFDWPAQPDGARRFHLDQRFFTGGDAFALYALMRYLEPARIIEVGSGYSSALMLDVAERFLDPGFGLTCIEPEPHRLCSLLQPGDADRCSVLESPVQNVPIETFDSLGERDILFVDSSHVSKIGSDVNRLLFDVLLRLVSGVVIHFHDVFWPFEYPEQWVMDGRGWNEAYMLRAFLEYNEHFEVLFWPSHLASVAREELAARLPEVAVAPGGSLWLKKTG